MTYTKTFATIDRGTIDTVDTQEVRRLPTTARAFYLPSGSYRVHTIQGEIEVDAPTWIVFDAEGYPYPVKPSVFDETWETAPW